MQHFSGVRIFMVLLIPVCDPYMIYCKIPKYTETWKIAVIILKFDFFIWVLYHSFWAKSISRWVKMGEPPEINHLTTNKQNLACRTSNPS